MQYKQSVSTCFIIWGVDNFSHLLHPLEFEGLQAYITFASEKIKMDFFRGQETLKLIDWTYLKIKIWSDFYNVVLENEEKKFHKCIYMELAQKQEILEYSIRKFLKSMPHISLTLCTVK